MPDKDRDDLAQVIQRAYDRSYNLYTPRTPTPREYDIADAVLSWMAAAGFTRPHTVTTIEELDALPVRSVIRNEWAVIWEKCQNGWWRKEQEMSEREELAKVIFLQQYPGSEKAWDASGDFGKALWFERADAILAAGWRRPRSMSADAWHYVNDWRNDDSECRIPDNDFGTDLAHAIDQLLDATEPEPVGSTDA